MASDFLSCTCELAQCAIARATGRKIHVHGHIPPAIDSFSRTHSLRPEYIRSYWAFIARNADVLAGHFFGHWHSAEVRAVSSTSSVVPSPSATLLDAPALQALASLSPVYSNNPAFYSAQFDNATYRLHALTQFVLELRTLGSFPNFVASPRVIPTAGLTNRAYEALIRSWLTPAGDEAFRQFWRQQKTGVHGSAACESPWTPASKFDSCATCTGACRVSFACVQLAGLSEDEYAQCLLREQARLG